MPPGTRPDLDRGEPSLESSFVSESNSAPVSFVSLGLPAVLAESLARGGIESPFPIQAATLPDTLAGRDVLGRGRTGSGKTLAFALPMVATLARLVTSEKRVSARTQPGRPRGLILAPTRELANQIVATVEPLAKVAGLKVMTIFGGVAQGRQVQQLRAGTDIVVATPGRLEDLMKQGQVHLDAVAITVLDEADHMADLGFLPGVTRILAATPADGQRLLFSATLDNGIDKLSRRFLNHPLIHSVDSAESPVAAMTHHVLLVPDATTKRQVVRTLAGGSARRLLFTRTKHQARKLARELTADGIPAVEMHGNLSQNARERGLKAFADGKVRVMVATDIAARGIHVDGIELVVHVDPPAEHKAYLHRSGRTARAGHDGDVVTLVLPEQRRDFQSLARAAKITARPVPTTASDPQLIALAGHRAVLIAAADAPAAAARRESAPQPGNGGRSRSNTGNRSQRSANSQRSGSSQRSTSSQRSGNGQHASNNGRSGGPVRSAGAPRPGTGNGAVRVSEGNRRRPTGRRAARLSA
jgi:superfamily II DNA/RNA helicase